jgi:hypothetical protein
LGRYFSNRHFRGSRVGGLQIHWSGVNRLIGSGVVSIIIVGSRSRWWCGQFGKYGVECNLNFAITSY